MPITLIRTLFGAIISVAVMCAMPACGCKRLTSHPAYPTVSQELALITTAEAATPTALVQGRIAKGGIWILAVFNNDAHAEQWTFASFLPESVSQTSLRSLGGNAITLDQHSYRRTGIDIPCGTMLRLRWGWSARTSNGIAAILMARTDEVRPGPYELSLAPDLASRVGLPADTWTPINFVPADHGVPANEPLPAPHSPP